MKTNPSSHLAFIFCAVALLTFVSCSLVFMSCRKSNPVGPPPSQPDTTSNDFIWSQTPIGTYGTSLQDIVAFSDTDVWICGEIRIKDSYTYDSLGNWIMPYNVGHYDGRKWVFDRIQWCGIPKEQYSSIAAMYGANKTEIWFSNGGALALWDGKRYQSWCIPFSEIPGAVFKIFKNTNKIYLAGIHGSLAVFDGTNFKNIATGTDNTFFDGCTAGNKTLCATSKWPAGETEPPTILVIENGQVSRWIDSTMMLGMQGIWFDAQNNIFTCGFRVKRWYDSAWIKEYPLTSGFLMHIRGQAWNDVFAVGHFGTVDHYNGKKWKHLTEAEPTQNTVLYRVSYVKDNVYFIGTNLQGQFSVFHGKRRR
jgi:hypothetical protein